MAHPRHRKTREQQVRRLAHRYGFRLEKSRRRTPQARDYGRYRLVDVPRHTVVYGGIPDDYSATLDDIEHFLRHLPPRPTPA